MQTTVYFTTKKDIHMIKSGLTVPYLANICGRMSTTAKLFHSTATVKVDEKRENTVGRSSFVSTREREAVVNETFVRDSLNKCEAIVGLEASHFNPYSMCQATPTGPYIGCDQDSESDKLTPRQNKTRSFEIMLVSYFHIVRPQLKVNSFSTMGK